MYSSRPKWKHQFLLRPSVSLLPTQTDFLVVSKLFIPGLLIQCTLCSSHDSKCWDSDHETLQTKTHVFWSFYFHTEMDNNHITFRGKESRVGRWGMVFGGTAYQFCFDTECVTQHIYLLLYICLTSPLQMDLKVPFPVSYSYYPKFWVTIWRICFHK